MGCIKRIIEQEYHVLYCQFIAGASSTTTNAAGSTTSSNSGNSATTATGDSMISSWYMLTVLST